MTRQTTDKPAVLITGAAGFLGSYLARECSRLGYQLHGNDLRAPREASLWSSFLTGDLTQVALGAFLERHPIQLCFHLAGGASVPASLADPVADFNQLLPGTAHLLAQLGRHQPQCGFVLFSSAAVYGNPAVLPVSESAPVTPLSPYGVHKHLAEALTVHYARLFGLRAGIVRIFSAYGAGLKKQLFWDLWQRQAEANRAGQKTLLLHGTGGETRDFIHARDVARAALRIGPSLVERAPGCEVFNVANGQEITIRQAAGQLLAACASPLTLEFNGVNRPGDPTRWVADTTRLRQLGYRPEVTLEEGLEEYVTWARQGGQRESNPPPQGRPSPRIFSSPPSRVFPDPKTYCSIFIEQLRGRW